MTQCNLFAMPVRHPRTTSCEAAIRKAIRQRKSLSAIYGNYVRYFTPHVLGRDRRNRLVVLVYQFAGGFDGGLPSDGAWSCFDVSDLSQVRYLHDHWVSGPDETRPRDIFSSVMLAAPNPAARPTLPFG